MLVVERDTWPLDFHHDTTINLAAHRIAMRNLAGEEQICLLVRALDGCSLIASKSSKAMSLIPLTALRSDLAILVNVSCSPPSVALGLLESRHNTFYPPQQVKNTGRVRIETTVLVGKCSTRRRGPGSYPHRGRGANGGTPSYGFSISTGSPGRPIISLRLAFSNWPLRKSKSICTRGS